MSSVSKKKIRRNVTRAIANIKATFNNTYVTISDVNGETICWASAGTVGFKKRFEKGKKWLDTLVPSVDYVEEREKNCFLRELDVIRLSAQSQSGSILQDSLHGVEANYQNMVSNFGKSKK